MGSVAQTDSAFAPQGRRPWQAVLLPLSLLMLAVALRTAEYAHNKAIWLDEAYVALNVLDRDYTALLKPMEWGQAAPLGFLFAERFAVEHAGPGEYALRLVPYLAALAGAVLFWWLLRRWVSAQAGPIALALFALSPALTRYAAEVKPYSTDVLVTLVLVALATLCLERMSPIRIVALALAGAAAIWCAYPAAFVLAGIGVTLAMRIGAQRRWVILPGLMLMGAVWLASFAWYYRVSLRALGGNVEVMGWWAEYYMPVPPRSLADFNWF
ncbi:MAG: glycosyltransferase family 39 protein, partial [Candidatus Hydrogenedentes bacterium]|nr:glycosyltransferase family 39 protein [Candidatus Hydrogenedentota bacterium]